MNPRGFLKEAIKTTRREIALARQRISETTLRSDAEQTPPGVSFTKALEKATPESPGIIPEIKRGDPATGLLAPSLDPVALAQACEKAGAQAICVMTDSIYFKGSMEDLERIQDAVDLPLVRRDFILSAYQIFEAKRAGASAVSLITPLLSPAQQKDYVSLVRELGMEPLVEITSEWEFEQAYQSGARVLGINNQDLATLDIDPHKAPRVAAILPDEMIPLALSGIASREIIETGIGHGILNFMVGRPLVQAHDPATRLHYLKTGETSNE